MDRLLRNSLIIFAVVTALCFAALATSIVTTRRQAKTLLEDLHRLDAAADATLVFNSLRQKYGNQLKLLGCASDECFYNLSFTNGFVGRLHFIPGAEIRIQFTVRHSSLSGALIEYTSSIFNANSPIVNIDEAFCAIGTQLPCDGFWLNPHGLDQSSAWNGLVGFGQRAPEKQKHAALALNLDCLTAFGGCKDISELLPAIWKRTRSGVVSSRWRSMADSIEDTSHPLPN
jgi:hypothetical protein